MKLISTRRRRKQFDVLSSSRSTQAAMMTLQPGGASSDKPENEHIPDLNRRELALMAPLVAGIIWLGVYPQPVLRRMEGAAQRFVQQVEARAFQAEVAER